MEELKKFLTPQVQGQLRHLLTALGPVLAAKGYTDDVMWQLYVGLGMAALGFFASWIAPEKK